MARFWAAFEKHYDDAESLKKEGESQYSFRPTESYRPGKHRIPRSGDDEFGGRPNAELPSN